MTKERQDQSRHDTAQLFHWKSKFGDEYINRNTLYQDISVQIPHALRHDFHPEHSRNYLGHEVCTKPGTRLASILGGERFGVNSFHHQSIKGVAPGLQVTAYAPDGVIEAVEAQDSRFIIGVQWHPEDLIDDNSRMRQLFEAFVEEARGTLRHR